MNNKKVLGLDVSKSSVCAVFFSEKPSIDTRTLYMKCRFEKVSADAKGLSYLLSLKPEVVILEPTGTNYARLWVEQMLRAGVEVRLVEHTLLKRYREHLSLPGKNDEADALALAFYYYEYCDIPSRFVRVKAPVISRLRDLILRLYHLNRVQSPIINRLRQDLAWQFPEIAHRQAIRQAGSSTVPLPWRWLAEEVESTRYDAAYKETAGLGLSDTVRSHAKRLCDLQREEVVLEQQILEILNLHEFSWYRSVFNEFGFGLRTQAALLSQIHPFESFLLDNGNPEVIETRGKKSNKPTKKHLSLRRFSKFLGVAPTEESSGDSHRSRISGGSRVTRRALWQWVFTRIEVKKNRPKTEVAQILSEKIDREKLAGIAVTKVRMRVAATAVRLLFYKLVEARKLFLDSQKITDDNGVLE